MLIYKAYWCDLGVSYKRIAEHLNKHSLSHTTLSCVSCDIPASRKVCGFLGHNAKLDKTDFSGYDRTLVLKEATSSL